MQTFRKKVSAKQALQMRFKKHPQESIKVSFFNEIPFRNLVVLSLVINIATLAFVIITQKHLPPQIPLFYGLPKTEEQVANSSSLVIPGILATSVMVINILISQITNDDYLKKILILTGVVSTFLATITIVKITFLVGAF